MKLLHFGGFEKRKWHFFPRWQLVKGKKEAAKQTMRIICRTNGRSLEGLDDFVDNFRPKHHHRDSDKDDKGVPMKTVFELFKYPATRRNMVRDFNFLYSANMEISFFLTSSSCATAG